VSGAAIPSSLKLASFNINGIKARLPRLLEWLEETRPSVACLQEIKTQDEGFPAAEFEKIGYHAIWHGQKGFNGVAILADGEKPVEVQRGLVGEPEDEHSRYLEADVGLRVVCIYLPNGNPQPGPKFDYKLRWMERLRARMAEIWAQEVPAAVLGDYNVIPRDNDIWDTRAMASDALMQPDRAMPMPACWARAGPTRSACTIPRAGLDVLGPSGRGLAARPWLPHRSCPARPNWPIAWSPRASTRPIAAGKKASDHAPVWVSLRA
jgi:exodeoxyribonuclease-3